jgi:4-hydroxybenzoate polyprenyltransferase/phosphoserine phosphatase
MKSKKVIIVDLDGTLSLTDTFHESLLLLVRNKLFLLFMIPFWLSSGRAKLKANVAEQTNLDVTLLPYNEALIDWLKDKKNNGEQIVLCTGANEKIARAVAEHLQIFDDVIASNEKINIKGDNKRQLLDERFGEKGYDYVGNSNDDLKVWTGSCNAVIVNASSTVLSQASKVAKVSKIFPPHSITISDWFRTLRVYQWLKNILLFVPLLASHQFDNIQSFSTLIFAFISFSLCASFVYITNDLFDLESDRYHPKKRDRPFASAKLPIMAGVILAPLLVFLSLILGWTIGIEFFVLLILYIVVTIIYSFLIKKIIILDCLTLSALFTLRIFAGAAATSIVVSFWLFVFSIFLFLSLAFVKRYAEIHTQKKIGKIHLHGRGYLVTDAPLIQILGIASGYTAMAVFALYLSSEKVTMLYSQPILLWLAKPLLIFWISWVWLKAHRGELDDDPIMFAIRDKTSLLVFGLITFIFLGGL